MHNVAGVLTELHVTIFFTAWRSAQATIAENQKASELGNFAPSTVSGSRPTQFGLHNINARLHFRRATLGEV
jgi:hypothetical protein